MLTLVGFGRWAMAPNALMMSKGILRLLSDFRLGSSATLHIAVLYRPVKVNSVAVDLFELVKMK
jgi:hypothetical protein